MSSLSKVLRPEVNIDEGRSEVSEELCQYMSEVCKAKASDCREELVYFNAISRFQVVRNRQCI